MRNEDNPMAAIAIPGWGMAIILLLIMGVMALFFVSMMRRLRAERRRLETEADTGAGPAVPRGPDDERTAAGSGGSAGSDRVDSPVPQRDSQGEVDADRVDTPETEAR